MRAALGIYAKARTRGWDDYSRLLAVGDEFGWSIDDDAERLSATASRLGYSVAPGRWARYSRRQAVFLHDHFTALHRRWIDSSHRLGLSYFHGRPGTPGHPEFGDAYAALCKHAHRVDRVQVTHSEMHELVLSAGVPEERVFRIPLGVVVDRFALGDRSAHDDARRRLGVPKSAFVVGSFQKDGVGMGEGFEPKHVKGPDVLVQTLTRLHASIPELFVLLTGLARGYVRRALEERGIPHRHVLLASRDELPSAYHALDVYVVPSRQEGGPKAVLEAMSTGVPLVATRVGQAPDIVREGANGFLVDVEDVDALVARVEQLYGDPELGVRLRCEARSTAQEYDDERLDPRWGELLQGFVDG